MTQQENLPFVNRLAVSRTQDTAAPACRHPNGLKISTNGKVCM